MKSFTSLEQGILLQCLKATAEGPFFPDWEFYTLMGFERDDLKRIIDEWPKFKDAQIMSEDLKLAINNSLNNLLGYPHDRWAVWRKYIEINPDQVKNLFEKWISLKNT